MSTSFFHTTTRALAAGGFLLASACASFAGTQEVANKEVAQQAAAERPYHFTLTAGIDSNFIFRGVNILPGQDLDLQKASDIAINSIPAFKNFILINGPALGIKTVDDFVKQLKFRRREKVARESSIAYFDGAATYSRGNDSLTLGGFYAMQVRPRTAPGDLGGQSFFNEYRETDGFLTYQHSFGPVSLSLGGTYYHVAKSSHFDTVELNFGVAYTPPQFRYVHFSFSYDYASAINYDPEYLDGHHLEFKVSGTVPVYKKSVTFDPYILLSAGAGIVPRAFNPLSQPTYFSNTLYAAGLVPSYTKAFNNAVGISSADASSAQAAAIAAFNPANLSRSFDLSNAQVGFRVPIYLTRYVTFTGNANYSRPLGNLHSAPYNQKDSVWGGVNLNFYY